MAIQDLRVQQVPLVLPPRLLALREPQGPLELQVLLVLKEQLDQPELQALLALQDLPVQPVLQD